MFGTKANTLPLSKTGLFPTFLFFPFVSFSNTQSACPSSFLKQRFYGSKKQCWYSQYPTSEFHQNTGFWKQVEICPPGAGCSFQVDFGVSSTSSSSTSSEWSDSLTESFETNMVFEKETL